MRRSLLIAVRVIFLICAVLAADPLYLRLQDWVPFQPQQSLLLSLVRETGMFAVTATLVAIAGVMIFRRFAYGMAGVIALPIIRRLWPWNPAYHDVHWPPIHWAISFYELFSFVAFVALATYLALRLRRLVSQQ